MSACFSAAHVMGENYDVFDKQVSCCVCANEKYNFPETFHITQRGSVLTLTAVACSRSI